MGILSSKSYENSITSYLPSKPAAIHLWRVFVDRVDPCCKILHIPTDEVTIYTVIDEPDVASAEAVAKCYAVYFFAVVVMGPAEVTTLLEIDKYTFLTVLKKGVEQALAHSELLEAPTVGLLQAFAIYLVRSQEEETDVSISEQIRTKPTLTNIFLVHVEIGCDASP